jgi:hypothetical protein
MQSALIKVVISLGVSYPTAFGHYLHDLGISHLAKNVRFVGRYFRNAIGDRWMPMPSALIKVVISLRSHYQLPWAAARPWYLSN